MPKVKRSKGRSKLQEKTDRKITPAAELGSIINPSAPEFAKNEKRKLRQEAWLDKLDHSYALKKKLEKKKNNQKNNLITDFSDIKDVLNTLPETEEKKASDKNNTASKTVISSKSLSSKKAKKKAEMQEIIRFQKVMQLPAFKQNPLAAIRQHVQNTHGSS